MNMPCRKVQQNQNTQAKKHKKKQELKIKTYFPNQKMRHHKDLNLFKKNHKCMIIKCSY